MIKKRTVGLFAILTAAAASLFALRQGTLSANPAVPSTESPPTTAAANQPCAYTWAYHDLPEVSAAFESAVKALIPEAEAHALAFGEDCVAADGSSTFNAMETDFYVIISVLDLNDNETLGSMIENILPILDNFPLDKVSGPKEGFVEITFQAGEDQRVFRVPLPRGRELREQGLHGAELIGAIQP